MESERANEIMQHFYSEVVGPYWPPERRMVETGYSTISLPFEEIPAPEFMMRAEWTLTQLLGYCRTWSATTRYIAARDVDPVDELGARLLPEWGPPENPQTVAWPMAVRVARKH
jgi:hypothetical protein